MDIWGRVPEDYPLRRGRPLMHAPLRGRLGRRQPARVSSQLHLVSSIRLDSMNPQRARRPTAWQVSFPDEISDGGSGGDDDGDDEKADEGAEQDLEGLEDDLPVLSCKRKTSSSINDPGETP